MKHVHTVNIPYLVVDHSTIFIISVSGYTSATHPWQGVANISVFLLPHQPILVFLKKKKIWLNICAAVWRPFQAPFSSNFICAESSGCLVSNGPNLIRFGATVVEISHSK